MCAMHSQTPTISSGPKIAKRATGKLLNFFVKLYLKAVIFCYSPPLEVVFSGLGNPSHVGCAQIWHKSSKTCENGVEAGHKSQSRQFLDSSVKGFRYALFPRFVRSL